MSNNAPAIPFFGDAYLADTRHLTLEEHGAYLQLMMIAWRIDGCCLPDDDKRLARMLGISAGKWDKLKPTVMAFWTLENSTWTQGRLSKERRFVEEKRAKNKSSAESRWHSQPIENKQPDECERISERNAPPTPPNSIGIIAKAITPSRGREAKPFDVIPDGVDPAHWRDFLANRKAKRLPNTETAYRGVLRKLSALVDEDWPPGRLIEAIVEKGWGGIYDPREEQELSNGHARQSNSQPKYKPSAALALYKSSFEGDDEDRGHDWPALPARIRH